jgi:hypothetical protein
MRRARSMTQGFGSRRSQMLAVARVAVA